MEVKKEVDLEKVAKKLNINIEKLKKLILSPKNPS